MKSMTVYHGSYLPVPLPQMKNWTDGKDFGKGFYATTEKLHAERCCKSAVSQAIKNGELSAKQRFGYVSAFTLEAKTAISVYEFKGIDKNWLRCVGAHRRKYCFPHEREKWQAYDILIGKQPDAETNRFLTNYIYGDYGDSEEESAVAITLRLMPPTPLSVQVCLKTEKALACLHFIGSYEVTLE